MAVSVFIATVHNSEPSTSAPQDQDKMSSSSAKDFKFRRIHPSQCDKIEPGLYLGDFDAAEQVETIRHLHISHVLTVASLPLKRSSAVDIQNLFMDAEDWDDQDLLSLFPKAISFIEQGQKEGNNCLVHCLAGISRSATLVIAFIMHKYGISFQEAYGRVEAKRPCINPNEGFKAQLQLYEAMKYTIDTENMGYKIFALHHLARNVKDKKFDFINEYFEEFKGNALRGAQYKCKKCRQYLFSESNVMHHFQGKSPNGTDPEWQSFDANQPSVCKSSLLVEPLSWMSNISQSMDGRLHCPKCEAKLGTFSWQGSNCSCGAMVVPQFKIYESKVDVERES